MSGRGTALSWSHTMRILVVVPTDSGMPAVLGRLRGQDVEADVLVLETAGRFGTRVPAQVRAAHVPGRVHVLARYSREGLGRAYQAGFAWALAHNYDVVVQVPPAGGYSLDRLSLLVDAANRADLVLCSRGGPDKGVRDSGTRRLLLSRLARVPQPMPVGMHVRDLAAGFRAWRTQLLASLEMDRLPVAFPAFQIESTLAALRRGANVVAVPSTAQDEATTDGALSRETVVALARARHARTRDLAVQGEIARRAHGRNAIGLLSGSARHA